MPKGSKAGGNAYEPQSNLRESDGFLDKLHRSNPTQQSHQCSKRLATVEPLTSAYFDHRKLMRLFHT